MYSKIANYSSSFTKKFSFFNKTIVGLVNRDGEPELRAAI